MFSTSQWGERATENINLTHRENISFCRQMKTDAVSETRSGNSNLSPAARDMISSSLMVYSD